MVGQHRTGTAPSPAEPAKPMPVTPSAETDRPEGLAFDVNKADMPGVPTGDQAPHHPGAAHTEQQVRESGEGVGLDVPGNHADQASDTDEVPGH
jgi:hypothetical protein